MFKKQNDKIRKRCKRKGHIRKRIYGTSDRPRMTVFRSNKNLFVQAIDDVKGNTIVSVSTLEKEFANLRPTVANAEKIGEEMGRRLKEKNVDTVVFDRNGYLYHGVVAAVADASRKVGLTF